MSYVFKGERITADYFTDYLHMQANSSGGVNTPYKIGDRVLSENIVGYSGNTGTATTGPHLHAELYFTSLDPYANWLLMHGKAYKQNEQKYYVDPYSFR
jgi:murein DD-endopeptidase MepM/ murein hydrolase activator NlpD